MIEFLNTHVLWWHWVVFGLLLLGAEVLSGTFLMLGLGIAAIAVGLADRAADLGFTTELLAWAALSMVVVVVWKRYWRQRDVTQSGQSRSGLDVPGTVSEAIVPPGRGRVLFDAPVLGSSDWAAKSKVPLEAGTRVHIAEVDGQLMLVEPIETKEM